MNDTQYQQFLEAFLKDNRESTKDVIKETVNGKIDDMREDLADHIKKHDASMKVILPLIEGISGARVIGKLIFWIAALVVAWTVIRNFKL